MFAFVVPGRLVQQTTQVPQSPERFVATIENAQDLNHITVFLTGQAPFPEGYGATVHLEIPGKGFQLIGGLTNAKPSAIFRLRGTVVTPSSFSTNLASSLAGSTSGTSATLGISCEPLSTVEAQLAALGSSSTSNPTAPSTTSTALVPISAGATGSSSSTPDPVALAGLVGKNLFNALGGFAQPLPDGSGRSWIEFGLVEKWYRNFERKLRTSGVNFLLSSD